MGSDPYPVFGASSPREYIDFVERDIAALPKCRVCSKFFYYPRPYCPRCFSSDVEYLAVDDGWTVRSRAVVYRPQSSIFFHDAPILMLVAAFEGVSVAAEGHGWQSPCVPSIGAEVGYGVITRSDGSKLPVFQKIDRSVPRSQA